MSKVTLNNITAGYGSVDLLNENFDAIAEAFDNTLSRNGAVPNTWLATQDANHQRLINLADPVDGKDAANKDYVINAQVDAIQIAFNRAAYHVDRFNGDGAETTFTLSVAPGLESNAQVYISGAYQNKNTFSVSGTTLTFTEAPPLFASIEVFVVEPLQVAVADAANVTYAPGGGGVQTTVESKLRETVSVKDFGAVGDGVTDDTAAIIAAEASDFDRIYVPEGKYLTTYTNVNDLSKVYYGNGQLIIGGYATARLYSNVDEELPAIPYNQYAALDDQNIPETSFHTVTANVNPSPLPTTYTNYTQYVQQLGYMQYSGGFNTDPGDHAKGRSGARHRMDFVYHNGQGDLTNRGFFGSVSTSLAGATHFLANPAIAVENGNIGATGSATGAYLQHSEYIFSDNGLAVAAIGSVRNYIRTNAGSSLDQVWIHDRPQSGGSQPIDSVYSVAGSAKVGLDFTPATLTSNKCAIALKQDDRIYLNASCTPDSIGAKWYANNVGTLYIDGFGKFFNVVSDGVTTLQASDTDVLVNNANGLTILNTGLLRFNGTGQFLTGSAAPVFSASNKPGGGSGSGPATWLKVILGANSYYIPCWA